MVTSTLATMPRKVSLTTLRKSAAMATPSLSYSPPWSTNAKQFPTRQVGWHRSPTTLGRLKNSCTPAGSMNSLEIPEMHGQSDDLEHEEISRGFNEDCPCPSRVFHLEGFMRRTLFTAVALVSLVAAGPGLAASELCKQVKSFEQEAHQRANCRMVSFKDDGWISVGSRRKLSKKMKCKLAPPCDALDRTTQLRALVSIMRVHNSPP